MTVLKAIYENPYRMLGVFANSGMREIVSQKNKISAPNDGQKQEISLDLEGFLPLPERAPEKIKEAYSLLTLPNERLKYAQFWFLKMTLNDGDAFQSLFHGDIEKAIHIWENEDSLSSLQNRMICYFLQEDIPAAIKTAEQLYARHGDDYQQCTLPSVHIQMERSELIHQFIDMLDNDMPLIQIINYSDDEEWYAYIRTQCSKGIIAKIENELKLAENTNENDIYSYVQKKAARQLMERTTPLFTELQNILPVDDVQYISLADKVGLTILDHCIGYYNNSTNNLYDRGMAILPMLNYARKLVCGEYAISRLDENIEIIKESTPPAPPDEDNDEPSIFGAIVKIIIYIILAIRLFAFFFK